MLISCPCLIDPLPLGTACLLACLATAESLMHTYHACRYPIYPPGCAFETRVECECVSFRLADPPHSSPSSIILHDLIARREDWDGWMVMIETLVQTWKVGYGQTTHETFRLLPIFALPVHITHLCGGMGDGCAVMCCLHRILVVLARACGCCC
jgi:hypothetical protein